MAVSVVDFKLEKGDIEAALKKHSSGVSEGAAGEAKKQGEKTAGQKLEQEAGKVPGGAAVAGGIGKIGGGIGGAFSKSASKEDIAGTKAVLSELVAKHAVDGPVCILYGDAKKIDDVHSQGKEVSDALAKQGIKDATIIVVNMHDKPYNGLKQEGKNYPLLEIYGKDSKFGTPPAATMGVQTAIDVPAMLKEKIEQSGKPAEAPAAAPKVAAAIAGGPGGMS